LRKLVHETAQNAETSEVTYDDITDLVHTNEQPWLAVFRESFRKRMSMDEVLNRRKKTMKSMYFFDYTHYNRHNKEDGEQKPKEPAVEKTPKAEKKEKRKKEEAPLPIPPEFSSKKRKIIPKKRFEN
jgi:tRNA A37 threonylcarbamoyladenosine dehydratase